MKGTLAVFDNDMAALLVDGKLTDLLLDPPQDDPIPRPEAIYRGILERPLKGMHGAILRLPDGQRAFLKDAKHMSPGAPIVVQIATYVEEGKASPVARKLLFKSRYVIVTPSNPGINIARNIHDEDERDRLLEIAHSAVDGGDEGLILRSACNGADGESIADDINNMLDMCRTVLAGVEGKEPELLLDAPTATVRAWRDWDEPEQVDNTVGAFEHHGILDYIDAAMSAGVKLGETAWLSIEPTRALIAIDVNTGGDFSPAAGLKTNLAAAKEISRQLLIRGLGGQITIDFAPVNKKERVKIESALRAAFRRDGVDTIIAGWTPLGNLELQRKRERFPLREAMK
ncbi:ribonuclease G [Rhodobacterales bacterium 52_120_T64]|nr:ribonuclease G [Rhodobacterales bacterium 52_120_T64]